VKAVEITTGQQEAVKDANGNVTQWVEIASSKGDVTAKDQVVVSGLTKLVDGSVVTIDKPAAAGGKAEINAAPLSPTAKAGE